MLALPIQKTYEHRGRYKGTVERQVKFLIKNLAIFFIFPSKEFLPISFKIQLLETSPQKQKKQRQKQLGTNILVTTQIWKPKTLLKETAVIETWSGRKVQLGPGKQTANTWFLVWRNRNKISQIHKDYFYLPFFLLIILCLRSLSQTVELVG